MRRLELFGEDHNIRPGWVTVGKDLVGSNFNPQVGAPPGFSGAQPRSSTLSDMMQHLAGGLTAPERQGYHVAVAWQHSQRYKGREALVVHGHVREAALWAPSE